MKTKINIICLLTILLAFAVIFISCEEPEELEKTHTHQWGEWEIRIEPNETEEGEEIRRCVVPGCRGIVLFIFRYEPKIIIRSEIFKV